VDTFSSPETGQRLVVSEEGVEARTLSPLLGYDQAYSVLKRGVEARTLSPLFRAGYANRLDSRKKEKKLVLFQELGVEARTLSPSLLKQD